MPTVPGRKKPPGNEARRSGNRACIRAAGNRSGHRQTASRPSRITRTRYRIRRHWLYCTLSARRQNRLSLHTRSPTPKESRLLIVTHDPAVCRSDLDKLRGRIQFLTKFLDPTPFLVSNSQTPIFPMARMPAPDSGQCGLNSGLH